MADTETLQQLKEVWGICQAQDEQKSSLIMGLFNYIENLSAKLSNAELDLRDRKDVISMLRTRAKITEDKVESLVSEKARCAFALVLIDGDCMLFKDDLVQQGLDGGRRAASLLKQAVEEQLKISIPPAASHIQVVVRVYTNIKGLAKSYKERDILPEVESLSEFVRGFNMVDALCDYIDAGNGKECSDEKIRGAFRLNVDDVHCQRIFFGGSADNGYARLLGPYLENKPVRERITLLEGPPFAQELADIKDRFCVVPFVTVFRSQKLPSFKRKVSFRAITPPTPPADYATTAAKAPVASTTVQKGLTRPRSPALGLARNKFGQRVDPPLSYSQQDYQSLKARKLCNSFHLLGKCKFLDNYGNCQHEHAEELSSRQLAALRAVARQSPCPSGLTCDKLDCIAGHRCNKDNCSPVTCWFGTEMHGVDITIVG